MDRYGRRRRDLKDNDKKAELRRLYRVADQDIAPSIQGPPQSASEGHSSDSDSETETETSDSSSDDEDGVQNEEDDIQASTVRETPSSIPTGSVSRRLAVVNLDWDHIRAVDLMAVFASYASSGGIESVVIYPSEFGKERMEREEMEGPPREIFGDSADSEDEEGSSNESNESDEDEDEKIRKSLLQEDTGEEFSSTKLRNYQLERLRYYYAVVTCASPSVAKGIYDNIDGREYLSTANFFDLRFIPDEIDFSTDRPKEECSKLPTAGYRPNEFVTAALQHSKVKLTWDADDGVRKDIQQRAFTGSRRDMDENELRAYLASDHSSGDDGENDDTRVEVIDSTKGIVSSAPTKQTVPEINSRISKAELRRLELRAKLGLTAGENGKGEDKTHVPVGEMKVTFTPGLSTTADKTESVFENEPTIEETTAERYIRKERERKARRKEKLKAERISASKMGEESQNKKKSEEEEDGQGFDDAFFTATPAEAEALAEQKKIDKRKESRARRAAEEKAAEIETAELEGILNSDLNRRVDTDVTHFSMSTLEKAEKTLKKQKLKKGKSRLSQNEKAALEAKAKDVFEMDVEDKRFAAVYERPEFALDPSHPRFRDTTGTNVLLNEVRHRRKRHLDDTGAVRAEGKGDTTSSKRSRQMTE